VADRTEGTAWPPFETEFAHAWDTPGHTRYQLPDTDVNKCSRPATPPATRWPSPSRARQIVPGPGNNPCQRLRS
jgi:hypothetical protein